MTNAQIFRRAADYIREHGWCQGRYGVEGGPRCLVGAISQTVVGCAEALMIGRWDDVSPYYAMLSQRLGTLPQQTIMQWNDAPERTAQEVIALLDSLADDEELKDQIAMQASEFNDVEPSPPPAVKEALPVG